MEPLWDPYPDLLKRRYDKGVHLRRLLGDAKVSGQTRRHRGVSTARDWYNTSDTCTALQAFEGLMKPRLWRRVYSPKAHAHCPTLETVARGCEQERDDDLDLLILNVIAKDGFADLDRTPEHRIARALARARENRLTTLSGPQSNQSEASESPLQDLALGLRLLGIQACFAQGHPEWCPCLQRILTTGSLPEANLVLELAIRFNPDYGLGSTA